MPHEVQARELKELTGSTTIRDDYLPIEDPPNVSRTTTLEELAATLSYNDPVSLTRKKGPLDQLRASGSLRVTIGELEAYDHETRGLKHLLSGCIERERRLMFELVASAFVKIHQDEKGALSRAWFEKNRLEREDLRRKLEEARRSGPMAQRYPDLARQVDVRPKPAAKKPTARKRKPKRPTTRTPPPTPVDATPNRPAERTRKQKQPMDLTADD